MDEKKENAGYVSPWTIFLAAGRLPMTAEERRDHNDSFRRYLKTGGLPSFDPGSLIDFSKAPWPGEENDDDMS